MFVSFDLMSRKDALAFAAHGEAFVAQATRKGRTEISSKQLNSKEWTAIREAQNWVRNAVVEAVSKKGVPTRNIMWMRLL